ncbi:right-handed parallel beta-helix repeat-containing protein [bacterium]|nr:right-handed parallel beta-helix repeat-containing protein [bacterium]
MMSRQIRRSLALAGVIALLPLGGRALAETTRSVPGDFATISEAVAASERGDTILVGPGIYQESVLLTDNAGSGLIIRSTDGSAKTTIVYPEEANSNESVVTIQRCSNSTQFVGFRIDGRGVAKRGIIMNSDSKPVIVDVHVVGAEYGFAVYRGSRPYLRNVSTQNAATAGLFVSGGSADVKDATFTKSDKFGVYIGTATEEVRLRNVDITDCLQVGLQAAESDFRYEGGNVTNNGDTGIILNETAPRLSNLTVTGHSNIGIVMEICSATLVDSRIADNDFGVVASIEGSPRIQRCVFENNKSYHIGIEGDAQPLIGGSLENANRFLGDTDYRIQHTSTQDVIATYNFWDLPCSPKKFFQINGGGKLRRKPWASGNLLRSFEDCKVSRKYNLWWKNGKLDENGEHINGRTAVEVVYPNRKEEKPSNAPTTATTGTTPRPQGE